MILYDYIKLETEEQANYLWEYGEFFSSKVQSNSTLVFYLLNEYYVVVEIRKNEISSIKPFRKGHYLDDMIESIQIEI